MTLDVNGSYFEPYGNATTLLDSLNKTTGLSFSERIGANVLYQISAPRPLVYAIPYMSNENLSDFSMEPPSILNNVNTSYSALSTVTYDISITNASVPFVLVFGETFDNGWQLSGDGAAAHLVVYGYANGWVINRTGTYTLRIYYAPQTQYNMATILGIIGVIFPIIMIMIDLFSKCGFKITVAKIGLKT